MYSFFPCTQDKFTLKETLMKSTLTSNPAHSLFINKTFEKITKNWNLHFSYQDFIKRDIILDKLLLPEYLQARKKGNKQFLSIYEIWRAKSSLPLTIISQRNIISDSSQADAEEFFKEGKEREVPIPKFIMEILYDLGIFVAFFTKFLTRIMS